MDNKGCYVCGSTDLGYVWESDTIIGKKLCSLKCVNKHIREIETNIPIIESKTTSTNTSSNLFQFDRQNYLKFDWVYVEDIQGDIPDTSDIETNKKSIKTYRYTH
jgi:hypothetical protein